MVRLWFFAVASAVVSAGVLVLILLEVFFPSIFGTGGGPGAPYVEMVLFLPVGLLAGVRSVEFFGAVRRKEPGWRPTVTRRAETAAWMITTFGVSGLVTSLLVAQPNELVWRAVFGTVALAGIGLLIVATIRRRRGRQATSPGRPAP
jgi:hypothetical protein